MHALIDLGNVLPRAGDYPPLADAFFCLSREGEYAEGDLFSTANLRKQCITIPQHNDLMELQSTNAFAQVETRIVYA